MMNEKSTMGETHNDRKTNDSERPNPVLLEVFKNRFSSICDEMGVTLNRTAFSPNIKERRDFSCALFDGEGQMISQAAHIPVHLGSMPLSVQAAIAAVNFEAGDMVMLNDPYKGGTHLPDITLVAPVFWDEISPPSHPCFINDEGVCDDEMSKSGTLRKEHPLFFVANRAHHADVGGMTSGSMPLSSTLFQEGVIIPPLKIIKRGKKNDDLMTLFLSNVRTPHEREGDFSAQIMANVTGIRRMHELLEKYGLSRVQSYATALMTYSERITRKMIAAIPDGVYTFQDVMESDGKGTQNIHITGEVTIAGDAATIDFRASHAQVSGSINAVYAITLSAVIYVFRTLIQENIPFNAGCFRPLTVLTKKGSIVDAVFPAAVAGGNVETSQRIVDVVLGALNKALPGKIPAASQGTMNNLTVGGIHHQTGLPFAYYETLAGGMGATAVSDGERAVHSHMTNTLNTPVEALEYSFPFLVTEYSIRKGSGGKGRYCGGDGMIREMRMLTDVEVTVLSERRVHPPYGIAGGDAGVCGKNSVIRRNSEFPNLSFDDPHPHGGVGVDGTTDAISSEGSGILSDKDSHGKGGHREEILPGKFHAELKKGETLRIETPGGGGYGVP